MLLTKRTPCINIVIINFGYPSSGFSYGTRQRNIVWQSSESLWLDAAIKNPKNGRALMNYGLSDGER